MSDKSSITQDPLAVFVVHGRHELSRQAMFDFLSALGLQPLEWSYLVRLTGKGSPYVGEVLDAGFKRAMAAVVLFTPDDEARLRQQFRSVNEPLYETALTGQARPNVILEAGMALGIAPDRTILVELGTLRPISDLMGRHVIRINNTEKRRREFAERLETAGCVIDLSGSEWKSAGNFDGAAADLQHSADDADPALLDLAPGYTIETSKERGHSGNDFYDLEYPQIQDLSNSYIQRRINAVLEQEFRKLMGLVDEQGRSLHSDYSLSEGPPTSSWVSFDTGLTTASLLSFRADQFVDIGGAHPTNGATGFLVDISSGYRYSLDDLFRPDLNYMGILRSHIQKVLERNFKYDPDWGDFPPEPDVNSPKLYDFYFTDRELVIINLFSAHALHAVWASIAYSDLANIADPKGPLSRVLASRKASEG